MGMHTGLRFKGIVKKEFRGLVKNLMVDRLEWMDIYEHYPQFEFLRVWAGYKRSYRIPFGDLVNMPVEWVEDSVKFKPNFEEDTGLWTFQCSLRNDVGTIEKFFDDIVPRLVEKSIHIERFYEEWSRSQLYEIVDGKVHLSGDDGIWYGI
ncbi:hypothetical protein [Bacillus subtilis]|uniref:hypothetical protein n=1 Tax=Bacillus subtilis TaxID=1423 RepID=UPI001CFA9FE5|nr:hypothetical protein [Bacillus subtilis]